MCMDAHWRFSLCLPDQGLLVPARPFPHSASRMKTAAYREGHSSIFLNLQPAATAERTRPRVSKSHCNDVQVNSNA